jgi:hypothetical protein
VLPAGAVVVVVEVDVDGEVVDATVVVGVAAVGVDDFLLQLKTASARHAAVQTRFSITHQEGR